MHTLLHTTKNILKQQKWFLWHGCRSYISYGTQREFSISQIVGLSMGTYQYRIVVYLFTYRSDIGIANFHTKWVPVLDRYVPFHIPIRSWYRTGIGPKADLCLVRGRHKPSIKIGRYQVGFNSEDLPVRYWYQMGIASVDIKPVHSFTPTIHTRTYIIPRLHGINFSVLFKSTF